ncbi:MAG: porin [Methylotenera sp.]|nr:porin [Methylotenera sp.]
MNNTIKLAVASALLAAASSANAGIMIPAGDWTLDIGGVVNAYYSYNKGESALNNASAAAGALTYGSNAAGEDVRTTITTGLLPNYLSVSGKTRQNDLDVGFTISIQPGAATTTSLNSAGQENRQAFLTFGDASWGTIKLGRDLGIFASSAILSDMTLLGVGGAGSNAAGTTTLGGIGFGYLYADWKAQVSYASPNWNGFSFAVGVTQPWKISNFTSGTNTVVNTSTPTPGFEGQASYAWAGDVSGKVWAGAIYQKVEDMSGGTIVGFRSDNAQGFDIGANVNVAGFGLTGYYYNGEGMGTTGFLSNGFDAAGNARDSDGGYVQATYTIPGAGTKVGLAYGISNLDQTSADSLAGVNLVDSNERWTVGAYHPLTKHLNLVAEYNRTTSSSHKAGVTDADNDNLSLGAILFF